MKEMLTIPGFIGCTLADVEHLARRILEKRNTVAMYRVESLRNVEQYFEFTPRLRGDGESPRSFSCTSSPFEWLKREFHYVIRIEYGTASLSHHRHDIRLITRSERTKYSDDRTRSRFMAIPRIHG